MLITSCLPYRYWYGTGYGTVGMIKLLGFSIPGIFTVSNLLKCILSPTGLRSKLEKDLYVNLISRYLRYQIRAPP